MTAFLKRHKITGVFEIRQSFGFRWCVSIWIILFWNQENKIDAVQKEPSIWRLAITGFAHFKYSIIRNIIFWRLRTWLTIHKPVVQDKCSQYFTF
jgi:hypothetical protein